VGKRARFEKNKEDERKPQELREEDIARSENETTKHVIDVSSYSILPPFLLTLVLTHAGIDSKLARGTEWPRESFQIRHQPERFCAIRREPVLPLVLDQRWRMRARNRGRRGTRHLCVFLLLLPDWKFSIQILNSPSPPVICEQPQMSDYQDGLKKQQLVFEFDVKTWEVGHHFCVLMIRSSALVRYVLGSDQNIQHYRSHHSTKIESGQLEWEVVRVMRTTTLRYA
jgi:hypothetical protein